MPQPLLAIARRRVADLHLALALDWDLGTYSPCLPDEDGNPDPTTSFAVYTDIDQLFAFLDGWEAHACDL